MNRWHRTRALLVALVAALCLGAAGVAAAGNADVILYNGKVFTSDPDHPWAQAVAVKGHRIQVVGGNAQVLAQARPGTKVLDLAGRTVIPGLNDAHVHALAPQGVQLNIPDFAPGPGPSLQEVLDLIAQATQNVPAGTWLFVAVGPRVGDDPLAHRLTLDQVSPHHPVKLEMWTGHGMYFNTRGLQALGIAENEPDPFGGFFERFPGTGALNGVVHEYAEHLVRRRFAEQLTDAQIAAIYETFAQKALAFGFTSVQNMSVGLEHARSVRILTSRSPISVRCWTMGCTGRAGSSSSCSIWWATRPSARCSTRWRGSIPRRTGANGGCASSTATSCCHPTSRGCATWES